jgi:hypothetical protein
MHGFEHYAIIKINDLDNVDFTQIGETSVDTIRKSLDETMFVLKWETMPDFYNRWHNSTFASFNSRRMFRINEYV